MKEKIHATFNLRTHESQYRHFVSLFGSKYTYKYSKFNGNTVVDAIENL